MDMPATDVIRRDSEQYTNLLEKLLSGVNGYTSDELDEISKAKEIPTVAWLLSQKGFRAVFRKVETIEEVFLPFDPLVGTGLLGLPVNDGKEGDRKKLVGSAFFLAYILQTMLHHHIYSSGEGITIPNKNHRSIVGNLSRRLLSKMGNGIEHIYEGDYYELRNALNQLVFDCEHPDKEPVFATSNKAIDRKWIGYRIWSFFSERYGKDMTKEVFLILNTISDDPSLDERTVRRNVNEWKEATASRERFKKYRNLSFVLSRSDFSDGK
ncbi:MAG: hypothetical protein RPT95_15880 [Candidatus Sedimenticola sp. (ex Thyasira tokunagai)]